MCYRGTSFALAYSPGILKMRGLWRRTRDLIGSAPGAGGQAAIAPGDPTVKYRLKAIPPSEMETTIRLIRSHPEYFNGRIAETYAALGLKVIDDSFGREVSDHAAEALKSAVPFSVVRFGDREWIVLSFGAYDTSYLDRYVITDAIENYIESFRMDEASMILMRETLLSAVLQADIVGVCGIGKTWNGVRDTDKFIVRLQQNLRGFLGVWRGFDHCLRLARSGTFEHKVIASTHLYFGVIKHLHVVLPHARRILLVTSRPAVLPLLQKRFPKIEFQLIHVGRSRKPQPDAPVFLAEVAASLPPDMRGWCALSGGGLWGKLYCTWIKQRGGVAIDIGSGFDLLSGAITRPVHRRLGLDEANPYVLGAPISS